MDHPKPTAQADTAAKPAASYLTGLDYSVVQQCMHCGMCLPSCPTYLETGLERNSPRGRIALMRSIADGDLEVTKTFGEEMYYCLGCLACTTACPAGVNYPELFENARAEIEAAGVLDRPMRRFWRWLSLDIIFSHPWLLRLVGKGMHFYQTSGLEDVFRASRLNRLLPKSLRDLEPMAPRIQEKNSDALIKSFERAPSARYKVGLLTGCVQDLVFSNVNRDTADVLLANACTVVTPRLQGCCGSLHAHNGDLELAKKMGRNMIEAFGDLEQYDAIITNAAGCGSHLKHFDTLLEHDPIFAHRAQIWSRKVKDISEWLAEIGVRKPDIPTIAADSNTTTTTTGGAGDEATAAAPGATPQSEKLRVTYHEACHLCHGQGVSAQPREVLKAIPGLELVELTDATKCCGSAGVYNITQPEQAEKLQKEKVAHLRQTHAQVAVTANPGCHLQLENGLKADGNGTPMRVVHPMTLLAEAYRREQASQAPEA